MQGPSNLQLQSHIFIITFLCILSIIFFLPFDLSAQEEKFIHYIGAQECKVCHDKKEIGDQYKVWTEMKHAKAFETLGSDKAKEIAAKIGVEDPQHNKNCLQCHSTAYVQEKQAEDALVEIYKPLRHEDGVQCESCHGPGDLYAYRDIMQNPKKARKLGHVVAKQVDCTGCHKEGLAFPEKETLSAETCPHCGMCHNRGNPAYNPEKDTTPEGRKVNFYYPERAEKIQHYIPYRRRTASAR